MLSPQPKLKESNPSPEEYALSKAVLLGYLGSVVDKMADPNLRLLQCKGRGLSLIELIGEIETDTEIGKDHVTMHHTTKQNKVRTHRLGLRACFVALLNKLR